MSASAVKNGRHGLDRHGEGPEAPTASGPTPNGRDGQGRFTKNNAGEPGNPFVRQVAALRSALIEAVTPDDIRAIALELLTQAKCGNLAAIKLLFSYVLGQPTVAPNPDTVELDEWQLRRQSPTAAEAQDTLFERRSPGLVNAAARALDLVHRHEVLDLLEPDAPPPAADTKRVEAKPAERAAVPGGTNSLTSLFKALAGRLGQATAPAAVHNRDVAGPEDGTADRLRLVEALFRTADDPPGETARAGAPDAGPNGKCERSSMPSG